MPLHQMPDTPPGGLLIRADATPAMGVGHAMRCLALAQQVLEDGQPVTLLGQLDVDWVAAAYAKAGVTILNGANQGQDVNVVVSTAHQLRPAAVLLDGYHLQTALGASLRTAGIRVAAMVDGEFGAHQEADLYIDQNPGSAALPVAAPTRSIAGADYTLFRNDVLEAREARANTKTQRPENQLMEERRILAVFGGTDPLGAAPAIAPMIVEAVEAAGVNFHLELVTSDESLVRQLRRVVSRRGRVTALPSLPNLAARAADADLVVTASGSTVWELLCIGVPTAVVCVIDNQTPGYDFATRGDFVAGLGHLEALRSCPESHEKALASLQEALLKDDARTLRCTAGTRLLDGQGRQRVARAVFELDSGFFSPDPVEKSRSSCP